MWHEIFRGGQDERTKPILMFNPRMLGVSSRFVRNCAIQFNWVYSFPNARYEPEGQARNHEILLKPLHRMIGLRMVEINCAWIRLSFLQAVSIGLTPLLRYGVTVLNPNLHCDFIIQNNRNQLNSICTELCVVMSLNSAKALLVETNGIAQ